MGAYGISLFYLKGGSFPGEDLYDTIWITVRFYGQQRNPDHRAG